MPPVRDSAPCPTLALSSRHSSCHCPAAVVTAQQMVLVTAPLPQGPCSRNSLQPLSCVPLCVCVPAGGTGGRPPAASLLAMPRSLLVFQDEAYTHCLHGIEEVRGRGTSLGLTGVRTKSRKGGRVYEGVAAIKIQRVHTMPAWPQRGEAGWHMGSEGVGEVCNSAGVWRFLRQLTMALRFTIARNTTQP